LLRHNGGIKKRNCLDDGKLYPKNPGDMENQDTLDRIIPNAELNTDDIIMAKASGP